MIKIEFRVQLYWTHPDIVMCPLLDMCYYPARSSSTGLKIEVFHSSLFLTDPIKSIIIGEIVVSFPFCL